MQFLAVKPILQDIICHDFVQEKKTNTMWNISTENEHYIFGVWLVTTNISALLCTQQQH